MNEIYVVEGSTGEYSDRREWPVVAFKDKQAAADLVVKLTAAAKTIDPDARYTDEEEKAAKKFMTEQGDPSFQSDYTGTSYYVFAVELR